jgi:hypothetical protein
MQPVIEDELTAREVTPPPEFSEKKGHHDIEIEAISPDTLSDFNSEKVFVPGEDDEFIDPRLKDYPVPLVA